MSETDAKKAAFHAYERAVVDGRSLGVLMPKGFALHDPEVRDHVREREFQAFLAGLESRTPPPATAELRDLLPTRITSTCLNDWPDEQYYGVNLPVGLVRRFIAEWTPTGTPADGGGGTGEPC
jgi:hypothetical protein